MNTPSSVFQNNPYLQGLDCSLALPPPDSKDVLCARLDNLLGRSVAELALLAQLPLPPNNNLGKGFVGQLVELFLGADSSNASQPDFSLLDIELKTISVGYDLMPQSSTSVCSMKLDAATFVPFEESPLYHKLCHMLFVVVFAPKGLNLPDRLIVGYFFYTPSMEDFTLFKAVYDDVAQAICDGSIQNRDYSSGVLQLRQRATAKYSSAPVRDADGSLVYTQPRIFCLSTNFTRELCQRFLQEQGVDANALLPLSCLKDRLEG